MNSTINGKSYLAGVDTAWERRKSEARKMLENAAESRQSTARFVGTLLLYTRIKPKSILDNSRKHLVNRLTYYVFKFFLNF